MTAKTLALAAAALLAVAPAAQGSIQHRAHAAGVPLPTIPPIVTAHCPHNPGVDGCVDYTTRAGSPTIYIRPGLHGRARAWALWHELGHIFDDQRMTFPRRIWFGQIMRYSMRSVANWWNDRYSLYPDAERFASGYAACAMRPPTGHENWIYWSTGQYDYAVTPAQHRQVCGLIDRA